MHRRSASILVTAALCLSGWSLLPTCAQAPPRFQVTDLGTLGGANSAALALNERGDVAGWSDTKSGERHGFLWSASRLRDLTPPAGYAESRALGLNDQGQVVGFAQASRPVVASDTGVVAPSSVEVRRAVLWDGVTTTLLGAGEARDINNAGEAVGRHFRWRKGQEAAPVTTDPGVSDFEAYTISEEGVVGGTARPSGSAGYHPALLRDNRVELLDDFAGGPGGVVNAINPSGTAVGMTSMLEGAAFAWSRGTRTLLGTMNGPVEYGLGGHAGYHHSEAFGVNAHGQVVGAANVSDRGLSDLHAFLQEKGALKDLNRLIDPALGWTLREARAINNRGQICGVGTLNGKTRAFLLTPE